MFASEIVTTCFANLMIFLFMCNSKSLLASFFPSSDLNHCMLLFTTVTLQHDRIRKDPDHQQCITTFCSCFVISIMKRFSLASEDLPSAIALPLNAFWIVVHLQSKSVNVIECYRTIRLNVSELGSSKSERIHLNDSFELWLNVYRIDLWIVNAQSWNGVSQLRMEFKPRTLARLLITMSVRFKSIWFIANKILKRYQMSIFVFKWATQWLVMARLIKKIYDRKVLKAWKYENSFVLFLCKTTNLNSIYTICKCQLQSQYFENNFAIRSASFGWTVYFERRAYKIRRFSLSSLYQHQHILNMRRKIYANIYYHKF